LTLIFDLDGTLYQTGTSFYAALKQTAKEFEQPVPPESTVLQQIGKTSDAIISYLFPHLTGHKEFKQRLRELEHGAIQADGLYPGIPQLLGRLRRQGHRLCICSNGSTEYIRLVLDKTGIRPYFDCLMSARHFPSKTAAVQKMAERYGSSCVVIGDTVSDFKAAAENRIPSVAAVYGYGGQEASLATFTASDVEEMECQISLCQLYQRLWEGIRNKNARVVGINGVDTSGKTTFAANFARYLSAKGVSCLVLHLDDYHNPSHIRTAGDDEIDAYYQHAFNIPRLLEEVIIPLKRDGFLHKTVRCLNLETDRYENERHYQIDNGTIVLLEGVLLFREPLVQHLDYRIFLEIGFDEVLRRAAIRDLPKYGSSFLEKYKRKYIPVQQKYIAEWKPVEQADAVLQNNDFLHPVLMFK
jgi:phosphoglycolate phosphatase